VYRVQHKNEKKNLPRFFPFFPFSNFRRFGKTAKKNAFQKTLELRKRVALNEKKILQVRNK